MLVLGQFPVPQISSIGEGTLVFIGLLVVADRGVSIWNNLRGASTPVMSRQETEGRFAAMQKELDDMEEQIREVDEARSRDVRMICDTVRALDKSIAASLNDVSRAIGRIEGGQELARSIKEGLETLAKQTK